MFEDICWFPEKDIDREFQRQLGDIFALPKISSEEDHLETDLGLDVCIASFHTGDGLIADWLPIVWRPKITLKARLYNVRSGQLMDAFETTEIATFKEFLSRLFTFRAAVNINKVFRKEEMLVLLNRASVRLLEDIVEATRRYA